MQIFDKEKPVEIMILSEALIENTGTGETCNVCRSANRDGIEARRKEFGSSFDYGWSYRETIL